MTLNCLDESPGTRAARIEIKRDSLYQVSASTWTVIVYAEMPNTDFQEEQRAPASRHDRKKKDATSRENTWQRQRPTRKEKIGQSLRTYVYTKHIVYKNLFMIFLLIYLIYDKSVFI